jgi:hypothetical protein
VSSINHSQMDSRNSLNNAPKSNASLSTVVASSHTTSSVDSHTLSPNSPIIPMNVEDVEHSIEGVHRSSVRDAGSIGIAGGRPPRSRKVKYVSEPSLTWDHFTRDETFSQEDPIAHYCGIGYKCHSKLIGSSMIYHVNTCPKYKSMKAKQD